MRLQDKVILITGSTTGIGEAMARRCVAEGARVLLHGRTAERGRRLTEELGSNTAFHLDDLADSQSAQRMVDAALRAFGRLDALVNNAADNRRAHLEQTTPAFFDQIMAVNLRAPLLLIRAALEPLAAARGAVLNIGSVLAYCGQANLLAYSVSKGGLVTLTRNLADTLGPRGVRVNQLNVGWTLTENEYHVKLRDGLPADWPNHLPAYAVPSGRLLQPCQIAAAAVYWLGDESRPVTGSVVDIEQYPVIGRIPNQERSAPSPVSSASLETTPNSIPHALT
ncbi:MAG: SDR family oxidoreductase [Verrucomicrobia bacterium]|nr:SDR family oxidoreductase [Verrucomicrobiota bacterium]